MSTAIIIGLVILQLLSFYFIAILNGKISKFKDLEVRQDQLLREMDDSISLYLIEMKQENDRLIEQLSKVKEQKIETARTLQESDSRKTNPMQQVEQAKKQETSEELRSFVPKNVASRVYGQHVKMSSEVVDTQPKAVIEKTLPFEEQVVKLHREGLSSEEIAKRLQRGKTEVELLIKFHA